jgi:hypothetical protein
MFEIPRTINGTTAGQQASSHFGVAKAQSIARAGNVLKITANVSLFPILSINTPAKGDISDIKRKGTGVHIAAASRLYPYLVTRISCANYMYPM